MNRDPLQPVTDATLDEAVGDEGTVALTITGPDCDPCDTFVARMRSIAPDHEEVRFLVADVRDVPGLVELAEITEVPVLVVFKDGVLVNLSVGAMYRSHVEQVLAATLALPALDLPEEPTPGEPGLGEVVGDDPATTFRL